MAARCQTNVNWLMRMLLATLFVAAFAFLPGRANAQLIEKLIISYDNHGGFAYGGCKLELYASGKYAMLVYDDAGYRSLTRGKYERVESTMTLTDAKGRCFVYRIALYQGGEYLLDDDTFARFSKEKNPDQLRGRMKRTD